MAFDSTLGFPGEGHRAHKVRMISWNMGGSEWNDPQGAGRLKAAIRRFVRSKYDVLCLQEHQLDKDTVAQVNNYLKRIEGEDLAWRFSARASGRGKRGGTAIIAKVSACGECKFSTACGGHVTILDIEGLKIMSIYASTPPKV